MARLINDARVFPAPPSAQSFFSSRPILPTSTEMPGADDSATMLQPPPCAAIARKQFVRFFWSPRAGGIHEEPGRIFLRAPGFFDWVDERPRFLNFVVSCEKRGVAAHRVQEEPFVSFRARLAERRPVMKIHLHR